MPYAQQLIYYVRVRIEPDCMSPGGIIKQPRWAEWPKFSESKWHKFIGSEPKINCRVMICVVSYKHSIQSQVTIIPAKIECMWATLLPREDDSVPWTARGKKSNHPIMALTATLRCYQSSSRPQIIGQSLRGLNWQGNDCRQTERGTQIARKGWDNTRTLWNL